LSDSRSNVVISSRGRERSKICRARGVQVAANRNHQTEADIEGKQKSSANGGNGTITIANIRTKASGPTNDEI